MTGLDRSMRCERRESCSVDFSFWCCRGLGLRCNRRAIPGLTPDYALATPRPCRRRRCRPAGLSPPGAAGQSREPYRLDSGDRVRVIVFGQDNLSRVYNVDASGYMAMPLVGRPARAGSDTLQLSIDIAAELRRNTSRTRKSASRSRLPALLHPGRGEKSRAVRLCQRHDGGGRRGDRRGLYRARQEAHGAAHAPVRRRQEHGDGPHDYPVQPGDTIYVLERFF